MNRQLDQKEFETIARLMREAETSFQEIDWRTVEALGKGRMNRYEKSVYGEQSIMARLLERQPPIIGAIIHENYDMVILLNPRESKKQDDVAHRVRLLPETTYSVNMNLEREKEDGRIIRTEGRLYGPNHSTSMTYEFSFDTVVFPLRIADLEEILSVRGTKL